MFNQRTTLGLALVGVLFAVGGWRSPDDVVEAKKFVLRDAQGNQRAVLMTNEEVKGADFPTLRMFSRKGNTACTLSALDSGPGFALYDSAGKPRLVLGYEDRGDEGDCVIQVVNKEGKERVYIGVDTDGKVEIRTVSPSGNVEWRSTK